MDKDLATNLKAMMIKKGFSMKGLSLSAHLNETAVRDIITGRVKNPTYITLEKLARVLECEVKDLTASSTSNNSFTHSVNVLDTEALIKSIIKVDHIIQKNNLSLNIEDKARVYVAWYELALLTQDEHIDNSEQQLYTLLKFAKK
ncbi:hypothetical protein NOVO_02390 [Rickettsiales bacterium Ac37b]|nr:hypothetical protein NOVO_02390 [Rickettsiales bacterium Ac37b]